MGWVLESLPLVQVGPGRCDVKSFFYFYIFFRFIKNICRDFFFKNVTQPPVHLAEGCYRRQPTVGGRPVGLGGPGAYRRMKRRYLALTAGSSGGKYLLPFGPAVRPPVKCPRGPPAPPPARPLSPRRFRGLWPAGAAPAARSPPRVARLLVSGIF